MARRHSSQLREVNPDPIYNDKIVSKFINCLLKSGKKSIAESIFYGAIDQIKDKPLPQRIPEDESFQDLFSSVNSDLKLFYLALYNVTPHMEVRSRRVGGATYQVPVEVGKNRSQALSIRWIIEAAKKGSGKTMRDRLAKEILDASNNLGVSVKKKEDNHKMAKANRAFAHYRW